jgi:hypothetical protein
MILERDKLFQMLLNWSDLRITDPIAHLVIYAPQSDGIHKESLADSKKRESKGTHLQITFV